MCSKYKYHSELLQADKTDELSKSLCMVQYTTTKVKKYRGIHGYINKLQDCNYLCLGCWSLWLGKQFLPGIACIIAQKVPNTRCWQFLEVLYITKGTH